jgi:LAGLIDADG DNA endonuclease family
MQDRSKQKNQDLIIATNSFTYEDCFLSEILKEKYNLKTSVVKAGHMDQ